MPKTNENVTLQKTAAPSRSAASMRPPSPCSALGSENLNLLKLFVIVLSVAHCGQEVPREGRPAKAKS